MSFFFLDTSVTQSYEQSFYLRPVLPSPYLPKWVDVRHVSSFWGSLNLIFFFITKMSCCETFLKWLVMKGVSSTKVVLKTGLGKNWLRLGGWRGRDVRWEVYDKSVGCKRLIGYERSTFSTTKSLGDCSSIPKLLDTKDPYLKHFYFYFLFYVCLFSFVLMFSY